MPSLRHPRKVGFVRGGASKKSKKSDGAGKPAAEVRLMDADGELLSKWPLDFLAQAVNVGPDGLVYLAGDGWIRDTDMDGKDLTRPNRPRSLLPSKAPRGP